MRVDAPASNPLLNGLLAFYRLDDANDSGPNGYHLTNNGDPQVSFSGGKIGNAATFNQANYLSHPGLAPQPSGLSVAAWVNVDESMVSNGGIASGYWRTSENSWTFIVTSGGNVIFAWMVSAEEGSVDSGDGGIGFGTWHHVAFTHDGSVAKLYIDGAMIDSASATGPIDAVPGFFIGDDSTAGDTLMLGQIDAVGVWNRAISPAEIAALYNSGTGLEL